MLGRRAVVGASICALAATGGGIGVAATHGSSNASTPKVHKLVRHDVVQRQHSSQLGHCHHDGTAATAAGV